MNLTEYVTAVLQVLAPVAFEAGVYTDALLTEALRQALREYDLAAPAVRAVMTVMVSGHQQTLMLQKFQELLYVAWPWEDGLALGQPAVRWHLAAPDQLYIEDGKPLAGDKILLYYRPYHTVEGLDASVATTVPPEHASLVTLGAAGWSTAIRYRALAEALRGPAPEQIRLLQAWSSSRLQEFRDGLQGLAGGVSFIRPAWQAIGL